MSYYTNGSSSPYIRTPSPGNMGGHSPGPNYEDMIDEIGGSPPQINVPNFGPTLRTALTTRPPLSVSIQQDPRLEKPQPQYATQTQPQNVYRPLQARSVRPGRPARADTAPHAESGNTNYHRTIYSPPSTASTTSTTSTGSSASYRSVTRQASHPAPSTKAFNPPGSGYSSGSTAGPYQTPSIAGYGAHPAERAYKQPPPAPLEWESVFHPSFLPSVPNFEKDWHFAGLYTSHILFSQNTKQPPSKKILTYDIEAQTCEQIRVKYDSAGLGPGGLYLLYRQGDEMGLYDVPGGRTIKNASLRNLCRWTCNALGFCILDDSGKLWRWSFADKLPPALVFRLVDRAPRDRMRCMTTRDGAWNAIVAVNTERTKGEVHCYPTDNDESRIFPGVLAAFTQAEVDGVKVTHVAVVNRVNEAELTFTVNRLGAQNTSAVERVETRMPFEAFGGGPPSAMFIDHDIGVAVVLATPPTETYIALIFDLRTGLYLMKQTLAKHPEDSWQVDDTGIFRERKGCVVQRLKILPEGLPQQLSRPPPPIHLMTRLSPTSAHPGPYSPHSPIRNPSLPIHTPSPPPADRRGYV